MDLRGGSLLRADGGFLIMYSMEAMSETGVWRALKRTLNHNRLEIQPLEMFLSIWWQRAEAGSGADQRESDFDRRPSNV